MCEGQKGRHGSAQDFVSRSSRGPLILRGKKGAGKRRKQEGRLDLLRGVEESFSTSCEP